MAGASVTNTGCFSVATVTKVSSVFRFLGRMSVNKVENCSHVFSVHDACISGRRNRRATGPDMIKNVGSGHDQTFSKRVMQYTHNHMVFPFTSEPVCVYRIHFSLDVFICTLLSSLPLLTHGG